MRYLLAVAALFVAAALATACSLCVNPVNRATLGEEMDNSSVALIGTLSNPKLGAVGTGTTDFAIETVLKSDPAVAAIAGKSMTLARYMPVPDPKQPPRMIVFFETFRGKLEPVQGVAVKSPALIQYLEGARAARAKGRVTALMYYANFLSDADAAIAMDAYAEFAKSKDDDVAAAGKRLDPSLVRTLFAKADNDADRLALYGFLLGCCGRDSDADELLRRARSLAGDQRSALDGLLSGYIMLRPAEGWKLVGTMLGDAKQPFATRFAALRTVRMVQGCQGAAAKADILAAYRPAILDGEIADLAVEDLRRWQWWDLTPEIAQQLGRPSHSAPILQHCLIRYAHSCPLPEGKTMLARARQLEPEYVDDLGR